MSEDTWTYPRAKCLRVVDGDTYDLMIDQGFNSFQKIRIRLRGLDTPETYGVRKDSEEYQRGKDAANFVRELFFGFSTADLGTESKDLVVTTHKDETGKYGRFIADVFLKETGQSVADLLREAGLEK